MATLTGTTIQSTYDSLLKVTDNDSITGSLKRITDGLGNNTPLYLSSSAVEIVSTLNVTSTITGSNLSGTNTGDETKASIETKLGAATSSNSGYLTSADWSTFSNKIAGSGTLNKLAKFSSGSSIADSTITDTGSAVTIGVATTVSGNLTATSLIKSGGTSSQILAADGSVITAGTNITIAGGTISSSGSISGTGTANYVAKFTGSTSIGNSLIYDNGSNVGIGIASPFGRFHSLSTGTGSNTISGVFSDGSTNGNAITISNATGLSTISATYLSTSIDSALAFQTTTGGVSSERMRITASGSVGIGTSSPSTTLDVNGSITSSTNVRALRFWGGPSSFTTHSAPLHIFSSTIGTDPIARFNNTESTDASTRTSMWLENYAGYRAEIAYTTHLNGSNIYINNTYSSGNILFNIASSEKARILNTGQFKLNGYTSTSSFTGTAAGYLAFDSSGNILTTAAPSGGITGSGTTNYVPKFTSSSAIGNSLIFDNGTNVGIGTTSPSYKLDTYGKVGITSDSTEQITIRTLTDTNRQLLIGYNYTPNYSYIQSVHQGSSYTNLLLQPSGGQVGIGTTTPASRLSVWNGEITISNLDSSYTAPMGSVGAYNANANTGGLVFKTSNSGTNAEKVRITSDGFVGIGTSSPATLLDINSSTLNDRLTLSHSGSMKAGFGVTSTGITYIYHHPSATFPMWISATGNVGIGNTSPSRLLSVGGQAYIAADIFQGQNAGIFFSGDGSYASGIYGRNSGNDLVLQSGSNERMRINSVGAVGIGTSSPGHQVHIVRANVGVGLQVENSSTYSHIRLQSAGTNQAAYLTFNPTGTGNAVIQVNDTDRLAITSSGNVGIGTSSPSAILHIQTSAGTASKLYIGQAATAAWSIGNNASANTFSIIDEQFSATRLFIGSTGNVGIGTTSPTVKLHVYGTGANTQTIYQESSTSAANAYLVQKSTSKSYVTGLSTDFSNSYIIYDETAATLRLAVASDGRFQVNNVGYSANCTATLRALTGTATDKILECITISYGTAFYVRNDGNYFFSGSNLSDARAKKDINYFNESILDKVMKLKPASFRYKENEENIKGGFIAQDIKELFPDLVTTTKSDDEMMGVDYYGVIAILTKAIQEQQVQIEELKAKLK